METRRTSRAGPRRAAPGSSAGTQAACERIWAVVAAIPRGTVTTYGAVAARAGLPKRARFVAFALNAAPPALGLPWHRVVAAGGRIALPATSRAGREQRRRLAAEGVHVTRGRAALPAPEADTLDALLWGAPR